MSDFKFNIIIYFFQRNILDFKPNAELYGWRLHKAEPQHVLYYV